AAALAAAVAATLAAAALAATALAAATLATAALAAARAATVTAFGLLAFGALASYGLARPAVESMYLGTYGADALPLVWLAVALVAMVVVTIYNRYAATVHPARLFGIAALVSAVLLVGLLLARSAGLPGSDFALYVWKDVYIVVLVEIFWTYANQVFPIAKARWLYGFFLLAGAGGSVLAELGVGVIAQRWDTAQAVWMVAPLLLLLAVGCVPLARRAASGEPSPPPVQRPGLVESFAVLKTSRYVGLLLGLIAITQVVITLVDYQFNAVVLAYYPEQDARTGVIGDVYAAISTTVLVLNALSGFVLRFVGVSATLLAIPSLLGLALVAAAVGPAFAAMVVAKVASKAFDYSLFRSAKEILYIPLGPLEKTRGKAIVDMLGYRVAKGLASLLILGLGAVDALAGVVAATFVGLAVWIVLTRWLIRGF
ncbi:MAG: Npt1/Npt2 family nucleotide transporter, partial [Myxococcota bacterium]|nr:Npt1/Npt2 family nucleotide transporter [Myxococcota bacterium]